MFAGLKICEVAPARCTLFIHRPQLSEPPKPPTAEIAAAWLAWLVLRILEEWPEAGPQLGLEPAPAVIGDEASAETPEAGPQLKPGPLTPSLDRKRNIWRGWLQVRGRQTQEAYCGTLDPPITPRTLRNYRDALKRAGIDIAEK